MPHRQNNPNTQVPPIQHQNQQQQQVPDHRFKELEDRLRNLSDQNQQLRGQVDYMAKNNGQQQAPEKPVESPFEQKVEDALNAKIQAAITKSMQPMESQFKEQIGYLVDKSDDMNYRMNYGGDKFAKYQAKVDEVRGDFQGRGRYISREDALRMVHFEETNKAPKSDPQQVANAQPKFDPYFGQMVGEDGQPIGQDNLAPSPEEQTPQQPPQQQQWPIQNQPQQVQQPAGVQQFNPNQQQQDMQTQANLSANGYQTPNLPQQGVNQQFNSDQSVQNQGHMNLELDSSDADLAAFENKYGDIAF